MDEAQKIRGASARLFAPIVVNDAGAGYDPERWWIWLLFTATSDSRIPITVAARMVGLLGG